MAPGTITITVNGTQRHVVEQTPLATLLTDLVGGRSGIAVAVNGRVVAASASDRVLRDGDQVEIITAIRGG